MASVHIAKFADMNFMFNIAAGVGRGRANQSLDVMLVQYLLSLASDEQVTIRQGGKIVSVSKITPPQFADNPIAVDGIYGNQTQAYIDFYQAFRNSHTQRSDDNNADMKFAVATDGAIDPWKFPAKPNFAIATSSAPLDRSSTLVTLSYDAAKSDEISRQFFTTMPDRLKRVLLAH